MPDTLCGCWVHMVSDLNWPAPVAAAVQEYVHVVDCSMDESLKHSTIEVNVYQSGLSSKEISVNVLPEEKCFAVDDTNYVDERLTKKMKYPHVKITYDGRGYKYSRMHLELMIEYRISENIVLTFTQNLRKKSIERIYQMDKNGIIAVWKPLADVGITIPEMFIDAFRQFQSCLHLVITHNQHVDNSDCQHYVKPFADSSRFRSESESDSDSLLWWS